eukprot:3433730-Rhodomonas_salina.2
MSFSNVPTIVINECSFGKSEVDCVLEQCQWSLSRVLRMRNIAIFQPPVEDVIDVEDRMNDDNEFASEVQTDGQPCIATGNSVPCHPPSPISKTQRPPMLDLSLKTMNHEDTTSPPCFIPHPLQEIVINSFSPSLIELEATSANDMHPLPLGEPAWIDCNNSPCACPPNNSPLASDSPAAWSRELAQLCFVEEISPKQRASAKLSFFHDEDCKDVAMFDEKAKAGRGCQLD